MSRPTTAPEIAEFELTPEQSRALKALTEFWQKQGNLPGPRAAYNELAELGLVLKQGFYDSTFGGGLLSHNPNRPPRLITHYRLPVRWGDV